MKKKQEIDFKIGTKKESLWTNVRDKIKQSIEQAEIELMINKEILAFAEKQIVKSKDL